jgi:hypothetical protein
MTEQELYEMKLHEKARIDELGIYVNKVVGGWIYHYKSNAVFVPEQEVMIVSSTGEDHH